MFNDDKMKQTKGAHPKIVKSNPINLILFLFFISDCLKKFHSWVSNIFLRNLETELGSETLHMHKNHKFVFEKQQYKVGLGQQSNGIFISHFLNSKSRGKTRKCQD
jgi:hypothetical protein